MKKKIMGYFVVVFGILAFLWGIRMVHAAAVTQAITLDSGLTVNYHVLVDDKFVVLPDTPQATGTPIPGPVLVFVNSYADQAAFNAGKRPAKTTAIKVTKSAIRAATNTYWSAILSELSANKATYLGQIK